MKVKTVKPSKVVVSHEPLQLKKKPITTDTKTPSTNTNNNSTDIMNLSVGQLWSRIKSSLNDLQAASLQGRQLARHRQQQLVHLGAKPRPREIIPQVILRGQRQKAVKRRQAQVNKGKEQREHVFVSEEYGKKHVQNKAIYGLRPAEERKVKEKEARLRRYRK